MNKIQDKWYMIGKHQHPCPVAHPQSLLLQCMCAVCTLRDVSVSVIQCSNSS